jgi:hypothetical protein
MDIYERRKANIKKLQEWYSRKHGGDTISDATAWEILRTTETWGYSIFTAAYDILMGDEPQ